MNRKTGILVLSLILCVIAYVNLERIADLIIYTFFNFNKEEPLTTTLHFFVFEVPKVMLLLILIVFVVGIVRSYFSPERTRKMLGGKKLFIGNVSASFLGIVTPFCSCSAIPLFLGFVESGVPLGVTFSFLIAAPMINEVAVVLLFGLFGWKTALLYMSTGLIIAMISGFIIGRLKLERYVEDWVYKIKVGQVQFEEKSQTLEKELLPE